jgi:hypothetical protein
LTAVEAMAMDIACPSVDDAAKWAVGGDQGISPRSPSLEATLEIAGVIAPGRKELGYERAALPYLAHDDNWLGLLEFFESSTDLADGYVKGAVDMPRGPLVGLAYVQIADVVSS